MEVALLLFGLSLCLLILGFILYIFGKWLERYRLLKIQPPPHWIEILKNHFPGFKQLELAKQQEVTTALQIYMAEKDFLGFSGISVTDEMRVLLSMQLIIRTGGKNLFLDRLKEIQIYPSSEVPPLKLRPRAICMGYSLPLYPNNEELARYFN
ncbi:MAG: hypothetical protein HN509_13900 [Halobacteriovoraceae bacterium]|jgi:MtfA peptidase|nr:hypothetical protein [Halobacteriovoraceae bacterium]MBT5095797.1 hypothetical protein [Halobacteriovoraceae bacterium]